MPGVAPPNHPLAGYQPSLGYTPPQGGYPGAPPPGQYPVSMCILMSLKKMKIGLQYFLVTCTKSLLRQNKVLVDLIDQFSRY